MVERGRCDSDGGGIDGSSTMENSYTRMPVRARIMWSDSFGEGRLILLKHCTV